MVDPYAVPAPSPEAPLPPTGSDLVDWITVNTRRGRTVISAIPPVFPRYARVVVPEDSAARTKADAALIEALKAQTAPRPWWLGYLDTGVADTVHAAPVVALYVGWPYVLVEGTPEQALTSRSNSESTPWHSALPPSSCSRPTGPGSSPRCGTTTGAPSAGRLRWWTTC